MNGIRITPPLTMNGRRWVIAEGAHKFGYTNVSEQRQAMRKPTCKEWQDLNNLEKWCDGVGVIFVDMETRRGIAVGLNTEYWLDSPDRRFVLAGAVSDGIAHVKYKHRNELSNVLLTF